MKITEVRIKLLKDDERLKAFASMVMDDCFVLRDCKVIQRENRMFISMPSRHMQKHCPYCGIKNKFSAKFCNDCGRRLPITGRIGNEMRKYFDIAHPITDECRREIEKEVLAAYEREWQREVDNVFSDYPDDYWFVTDD